MLGGIVWSPAGSAAMPGCYLRLSLHASDSHAVPPALLHEPHPAKYLCHNRARLCSGRLAYWEASKKTHMLAGACYSES